MPIEDSSNAEDRLPAQSPPMREVDSQDVLRGKREIFIRHGKDLYRLIVTPNGRLILRK